MAVLAILTQEAPILRQKAKRVARVDDSVRKLIDDMVDTMVAAPGVGLAANQVGVGLRVIVVKTDANLYTLVNPEMVKATGEQVGLEGCLSIPGYAGEVKRAQRVVVRGLNRHGRMVRIKGDDLLARALQHEIDHINGVLFIDRLTSLETLRKVEPEHVKQAEGELVGA